MYRDEFATELDSNFINDFCLFDKRILMAEQHIGVADGDDVIVEYSSINHIRILLRENHTFVIESVQARNCLRGFQRLPRREIHRPWRQVVETAGTINEELHATFAVLVAEAGVVGCALVAELRTTRQGGMVCKIFCIAKHRPQCA